MEWLIKYHGPLEMHSTIQSWVRVLGDSKICGMGIRLKVVALAFCIWRSSLWWLRGFMVNHTLDHYNTFSIAFLPRIRCANTMESKIARELATPSECTSTGRFRPSFSSNTSP
jgi:hypothetical protein